MKLGPHVIRPTPEALTWARQASIVKQIDGTEALRAAPDGAVRVFRHYEPNQTITAEPNVIASRILNALGGYRHPRLYVEIFNEVAQRLGEALEQHVALVRGVTLRLHWAGVKVAGFSFSTGQPDLASWAYLASQSFAGVDAVAIHEYWGSQGFTREQALRHRQVHEFLHGEHPPFLVTECGRDAIQGGMAGWKRNGISAEQYVAELRAYANEIERDTYVLGATVFTAGPTPDWDAFSTDDLDVGGLMSTQLDLEARIARLEQQNAQLLQQNALLTEAWKRFRQGKFSGADGIDGLIVAMQGGKPLDFTPSYPKAPGA